jgi:hypothetical protein
MKRIADDVPTGSWKTKAIGNPFYTDKKSVKRL